jgi:hypothetical protein
LHGSCSCLLKNLPLTYMQREFFPKILGGGFGLPHEFLGSEEFQMTLGTTGQGWCLARVLKEHQLDVTHSSVEARPPFGRSKQYIQTFLPRFIYISVVREEPGDANAKREKIPKINGLGGPQSLNRAPLDLHSIRVQENDSALFLLVTFPTPRLEDRIRVPVSEVATRELFRIVLLNNRLQLGDSALRFLDKEISVEWVFEPERNFCTAVPIFARVYLANPTSRSWHACV